MEAAGGGESGGGQPGLPEASPGQCGPESGCAADTWEAEDGLSGSSGSMTTRTSKILDLLKGIVQRIYVSDRRVSPPPLLSGGSTHPTSLRSVCSILQYLSVCIERLGECFLRNKIYTVLTISNGHKYPTLT